MSPDRTRLWETPGIDAATWDVEHSEAPGFPEAREITITASPSGFRIANPTSSDLSVLVTLMARATGDDEGVARERLVSLTSAEGCDRPLRVPVDGDDEAYSHLWQNDLEVREYRRKGFKATRSGIAVLPIRAGGDFTLSHDPDSLRGGVVVAAVAGVGVGLVDAPLESVHRGAAATIGELPDPHA